MLLQYNMDFCVVVQNLVLGMSSIHLFRIRIYASLLHVIQQRWICFEFHWNYRSTISVSFDVFPIFGLLHCLNPSILQVFIPPKVL